MALIQNTVFLTGKIVPFLHSKKIQNFTNIKDNFNFKPDPGDHEKLSTDRNTILMVISSNIDLAESGTGINR